MSTCDSVRLARALCMNTRTAITEETTKMHNSNSAGCSAYLLLAGSLLILLGNTAWLKSCKIDCHHFSSQSGVNAKTSSLKTQIAKNPRLCSGQNSTQIELSYALAANNKLGLIPHFEIKMPKESSSKEMLPPLYKEVDDKNYNVKVEKFAI